MVWKYALFIEEFKNEKFAWVILMSFSWAKTAKNTILPQLTLKKNEKWRNWIPARKTEKGEDKSWAIWKGLNFFLLFLFHPAEITFIRALLMNLSVWQLVLIFIHSSSRISILLEWFNLLLVFLNLLSGSLWLQPFSPPGWSTPLPWIPSCLPCQGWQSLQALQLLWLFSMVILCIGATQSRTHVQGDLLPCFSLVYILKPNLGFHYCIITYQSNLQVSQGHI